MSGPASDPRQELRSLRASWEWAFAHAHGCSWGHDPRLDWVRRRERELVEQISREEAA